MIVLLLAFVFRFIFLFLNRKLLARKEKRAGKRQRDRGMGKRTTR